ncbi:hypothetical protein [Acinetobacter sp.]|uniref:hypothetical protein n=1 Tax=Acinetobacter sp. TaxID=472 RepID=UPI003751CEEA
MKIENLSNKKFGSLLVMYRDMSFIKRIFWVCKCDCGGFKSIAAKHLKNGSIKTCGASAHRANKNSPSWKGYEEICGKYFTQVQRGAKNRKFLFDISINDMWQQAIKQDKKCALSGLSLDFDTNAKGNASLDRIDSTKGYTKENIQWVDKRINLMKMHIPQSEFIILCKLIANQN